MKTANEVIDGFKDFDLGNTHLAIYNRNDVLKMLNEYADQFRNPPKKTIEERKELFKRVVFSFEKYLEYTNIHLTEFFDYWSEHSENAKKMRFEKEKVFDIKKRLDRWKRNQKQTTHGRKSADEAIGELLTD